MATTAPAVGLTEYGGPDVLHLLDVPVADPEPGHVRLRAVAAAVNPTDTQSREGLVARNLGERGYLIPGMDVAGVVEAVGAGAHWQVGDRVTAIVTPGYAMPGIQLCPGGYASRPIAHADACVPLPTGADFVSASTLMMNGLTAIRALDLLDLRPGQTLGVTGAAGAVGGYAVALATARGIKVVGDASASDEDFVSSAGAVAVVPRGPGVEKRFVDAACGPLDGVLDAALICEPLAAAVKDGGGFAAVRPMELTLPRGIRHLEVRVPSIMTDTEKTRELYELACTGRLALRVAGTYSPDRAADAHRQLEAGGTRGRIVLGWDE